MFLHAFQHSMLRVGVRQEFAQFCVCWRLHQMMEDHAPRCEEGGAGSREEPGLEDAAPCAGGLLSFADDLPCGIAARSCTIARE